MREEMFYSLKKFALAAGVALLGLAGLAVLFSSGLIEKLQILLAQDTSEEVAVAASNYSCQTPFEKDYRAVLSQAGEEGEVFVVGCAGVF